MFTFTRYCSCIEYTRLCNMCFYFKVWIIIMQTNLLSHVGCCLWYVFSCEYYHQLIWSPSAGSISPDRFHSSHARFTIVTSSATLFWPWSWFWLRLVLVWECNFTCPQAVLEKGLCFYHEYLQLIVNYGLLNFGLTGFLVTIENNWMLKYLPNMSNSCVKFSCKCNGSC